MRRLVLMNLLAAVGICLTLYALHLQWEIERKYPEHTIYMGPRR